MLWDWLTVFTTGSSGEAPIASCGSAEDPTVPVIFDFFFFLLWGLLVGLLAISGTG